MNLHDLPDMSEALKQVQMYEKKKLDPVGQEDKDIDNDGDHDKSDSYLLNRRKTVTKAMGKKTHICAKMVKKEGKTYETIPEQHTMLEDGTVTHYDITDGKVILENVPVEDLEIVIAETHEHFDNYDKNSEVLGEASSVSKSSNSPAPAAPTNPYGGGMSAAFATVAGAGPIVKGMRYMAGPSPTASADGSGAAAAGPSAQGAAPSTALGSSSAPGTSPNTASPSDIGSTAKPVPKTQLIGNKKVKKEAFYFSDDEWEIISEESDLIDNSTDEELVEFFESIIIDLAEDFDDLMEICEELEGVEVLVEAPSKHSAMPNIAVPSPSKKKEGPSRMERMKSAAKQAGRRIKSAAAKAGESARGKFEKAKSAAGTAAGAAKGAAAGAAKGAKGAAAAAAKGAKETASKAKEGAKGAAAGAAKGAGYAVGTSQRAASGFKKHFAAGYKRGKEGPSGGASKADTKPKATKSSDDEDTTGGKLDALLKSARGTSSGSSKSSATASGGGDSKAKKPGLLKRLGGAVKRGLKRAVGKTARAISGGSEKLAKRMGEDYDMIESLYESGLFEIYEIEDIVEQANRI